jgi:hypothetical protein
LYRQPWPGYCCRDDAKGYDAQAIQRAFCLAALQRGRRGGGAADSDPSVLIRPGVPAGLAECSPIGRIYLFVLCMLPLFHWAHRFRYTLYDGLQIKHLDELVNTLCYGGAIVGTIIAGYLIWRIP